MRNTLDAPAAPGGGCGTEVGTVARSHSAPVRSRRLWVRRAPGVLAASAFVISRSAFELSVGSGVRTGASTPLTLRPEGGGTARLRGHLSGDVGAGASASDGGHRRSTVRLACDRSRPGRVGRQVGTQIPLRAHAYGVRLSARSCGLRRGWPCRRGQSLRLRHQGRQHPAANLGEDEAAAVIGRASNKRIERTPRALS